MMFLVPLYLFGIHIQEQLGIAAHSRLLPDFPSPGRRQSNGTGPVIVPAMTALFLLARLESSVPKQGAAAMRLNGDPSNRRWSRGGDRWSVATKSIKPPPWCSYLGTRVASLYS
jgi:hypothetical protein